MGNSAGEDLIGDALRRRREALGLDLSQVAEALKIKAAYLAALEAGCPKQLPGPAYAVGFLRAYAKHLGLDADAILRRVRQDSGAFGKRPDLAFPMSLGEHSIPGAGMLLVAAILAFCGYGTWYYLSTAEHSSPRRVAEVPPELLPSKPESSAPRPTEARAATPISAQDAPAPSDTPNPPSELTAAGAAEAATQTAALTPASPPQDAVIAPGTPARIVLHAVADSWVEIRDAGRTMLLARLLKAGEIYGVPDRPGLLMRTGNAGGLAITVDGSPAPSIGPMGAVRRNVVLEPVALAAGTAVRP